MDSILLTDILGVAAIISSLIVISSQSPALSVLYLICLFITIAGYLVVFGLGYLGLSYIIVYVGAVAILFLFVVIILDLKQDELNTEGTEYTKSLPLGGILVLVFTWLANSVLIPFYTAVDSITGEPLSIWSQFQNIYIGLFNYINNHILVEIGEFADLKVDLRQTFNNGTPDTIITIYKHAETVGNILYSNVAIWLLIAGLVLILSIVGPISINKAKTKRTIQR